MSNLRTTENGRNACLVAQRHILERRISRFFERNVVIDFAAWQAGTQEFDINTMLSAQGEFNELNDDEILDLYSLLGTIGGLPETIADINVYVDPTTGSDETGTGSATRPYASLWFLSYLPKVINHDVRIILKNDLTTTDDLVFDFQIGTGTFSIMGDGAYTIIENGITTAAVTPTNGTSQHIVNTVGPWAANHENTWFLATAGAEVNRASPVFQSDNAASVFTVLRIPLNGLGAADTGAFIRPTITLTCPSITFRCKEAESYDLNDSRGCRIAMVNLLIYIENGGDNVYNAAVIDNDGPMLMSFTKIYGDIGTGHFSSDINTLNAVDTDLDTYANSGLLNLNSDTNPLSFVPDCAGFIWDDATSGTAGMMADDGAIIWNFSSRRAIELKFSAEIAYGGAGYVIMESGAFTINTFATYGLIAAGLGGAFQVNDSLANIDSVDCVWSDNIIVVNNGSVNATQVCANVGMGTVSGYGIYFYGIGRVQINDAGTFLTGVTNDILFATVNPAVASAHPAAYLDVNDTQGTQVKRLA